jgi:hypothetical protein
VVVIPGGMASQLLPLDVSVNKTFKNYLRKESETLLQSDNLPVTHSRKGKRISASQLVE